MSTTVRTDDAATYFQAIVPGDSHYIDFDNTSKQSLAFNLLVTAADGSVTQQQTTLIMVFATQDCWINVGSNPTAVAGSTAKGTSFFLAGGIKDFIGVDPGQLLAVTRDGVSGRLHITECK